ncbi:MAG: ankyrin repeat domain-containing protein [Candidatus Competibacteraceae bacterium]|jgi:ankyrin repeat protein|nr:ankyrin repeat domain-containing protein [Candidatus Competibacteraceae bacterium]
MAKDNTKAFAEAFWLGDLEKARAVYAKGGVNLNHHDEDNGFTFLHAACRLGNLDAARWLLQKGAHVDRPVCCDDEDDDQNGATALMLTVDSIAGKQRKLIELLLDTGANINAVDSMGRNVVHYALEAPELLDLVLTRGANPSIRGHDGETPLMRATMMRDERIVTRLRDAGASEEGMLDVEFLQAVFEEEHDRVSDYLARGADVNFQSQGTALTTAVSNADVEMIRLLLDAGADVNLAATDDPDGDFNPLLRSAYDGHAEIVRLLIDAGADLRVANHGISPLDYAKMGKREGRKPDRPWDEVIKMIRVAGRATTPTLRGKVIKADRVNVIAALNAMLPVFTQWRRFAGEGVEILESDIIDDLEFLQRNLPAMQDIARNHGFNLAVVGYSLSDAEPSLSDLKAELAKATAMNAEKVFAKWEAEGAHEASKIDEDDNGHVRSNRQQVLAALTKIPIRAADDQFRVNAGHLVLCAGGVMPIPIAYRFGGWNSAPQPHEMGLVLQHWLDTYGAELIAIDHDTLAVRLHERLQSVEQVRAAAREVGLFCDESMSVADDIRTVVGNCWSFWWD